TATQHRSCRSGGSQSAATRASRQAMILRPLLPESENQPNSNVMPVWQLVARMQSIEAEQYLLVGQPDHARVSGEMAAKFSAGFLPKVDDRIARAIGIHDAGWSSFPFERDLSGDPPLT